MTDILEDRLRADLVRRAASFTSHPPRHFGTRLDEDVTRPRFRRRRATIGAALVVGALAATAVPAAAAAGFAPGVADAFGWTHRTTPGLPLIPADDATGHVVMSLPASQGLPAIALLAAKTTTRGDCYTAVSQLAGKTWKAGSCGVSGVRTLTDGGGGGTGQAVLELIEAPGAAYITVGDGPGARRVPVADGVTALWLVKGELNRQVSVTSFDQKGVKLQSISIDEITGLPKTNWTGPGAPYTSSSPQP